jgi:hypothetical protein
MRRGIAEFYLISDDFASRYESRLQVFDFICEAMDEADDSVHALIVNPEDMSLAVKGHCLAPESEVIERAEGKEQTWRGNGSSMNFVCYCLVR